MNTNLTLMGRVKRKSKWLLGERRRHLYRKEYEKLVSETIVGGSVLVRPRNLDGVFMVDGRSHLLTRVMMSGSYEPEVTDALARLSDIRGAIVNVGANIGFFACHFAKTFPRNEIIAIEPNPGAFAYLAENIKRNGLEGRVRPIQACIGDTPREIEFHYIEGLPEYSSIGGIIHPYVDGLEKRSMKIKSATLSDVVNSAEVGFIFADTEGAEEMVFKGARDIILRDKPVLYFECSDGLLNKFGTTSERLIGLIASFGYTARDGLNWNVPIRHPFDGEVIAFHANDARLRMKQAR